MNLFLALLCFVFLPLLIAIQGIDAAAGFGSEIARQKWQEKLQTTLDSLEMFADNSRFSHWMLGNICQKACRQNDPGVLNDDLNKIRKAFPGSFIFVVADKNGRLISELSDRGDFLYLYRQTFLLFNELEKNAKAGLRVESVSDFSAKFKRLKPFLGNMLDSGDLYKLFLAPGNGSSILASGDKDRFHLWYGSAGQNKLLAFISRSFIKGSAGLEWGSEYLNRRKNGVVTGFSSFPPDSETIFPKLSPELSARTVLALSRFEEMKDDAGAENDLAKLTACRFFNQYFRGFAFPDDYREMDKSRTKWFFAAWVIKFSAVAAFILLVYQLKWPFKLTVKLKIAAFFAYSIFLPLLVTATLGIQYLSQIEKEAISDLKSRSGQALEKIDAGYKWYLKQLSDRIDGYFEQTIGANPEILTDKALAGAWYDRLIDFANPGEVLVTDEAKTDFLSGISRRISLDRSPICQTGSAILSEIRHGTVYRIPGNGSFFALTMFSSLYNQLEPVFYLGIAGFDMGVKFNIVRPAGKYADQLFFAAISWEMHQLQKEYLKYLEKREKQAGFLMTAYCRYDEKMVTGPGSGSGELVNSIKQAVNRQTSQLMQVRIDGKPFLLFAMQGRRLNRLVLGALIPFDKILQQRLTLFSIAGKLFFVISLFSLATVFLLQSWIFGPISELMTGIQAIADRNFSRRLQVRCNNEFGKLTQAFNSSIETLQELEVARTVQDSLLVENRLDSGRCAIFARTRMMTNLGGDYYDFMPLANNQVLVFVGDATGHGIPAALSMAMAKSVLLYENIAGLTAEKLMKQLNTVFTRLRSQGVKDFMTALCVQLDNNSGAGKIINSGHCYPIIIRKGGRECEILSDAKGLPPGFVKNDSFFSYEFKLEMEDRLVLFTDGFVECCNSDGQYLGFDGLAGVLLETFDQDPGRHVEKVFTELERISENPQDDYTMVMLRFG